jgi:hypothetical protein
MKNTEIRAIIIAAGDATRWGNHLGTPKHLVPVDGVPILHRAVDQLLKRGVTDIHIVGPQDKRYELEGTKLYVPTKNPHNQDADKFLNSEPLWNTDGRTIVFYGDVFFTDDAMDTIVDSEREDWTLFCRMDPSKITGTPWGECFAQSFYPKDIDKHKKKLLHIAKLKRERKILRCGGWEHYRAMNDAPDNTLNKHIRYDHYVDIDDWTDDFDFPKDYDRFIAKWKKR